MKKLNILFCLLIVTHLTSAQVPAYVPTDSLVSWYSFTGNANDSSGNGLNGTVYGATLDTDRNGNVNSAYSFDGVDDYIISPSNPKYISDSLTISYWIKYRVSPSFQGNYDIIDFGGTGGAGVRWGCMSELNYLRFSVGRGCSSTGALINQGIDSLWHNVVFVVKGTNQFAYVDGIYISSTTNDQITSLSCATTNLYFGVSQWSSSYYYNGKLDDIGIWNRALTQEEVTNLYKPTVTGITSIKNENTYLISPNPCTTCEIRGVADANDIVVTDILGRTLNVSFTKTSNGFSISLAGSPAGVYLVKSRRTGEAGKLMKEGER